MVCLHGKAVWREMRFKPRPFRQPLHIQHGRRVMFIQKYFRRLVGSFRSAPVARSTGSFSSEVSYSDDDRIEPAGFGLIRRDGMNAHLSAEELDRRIGEREAAGKPTFLLWLEKNRRRAASSRSRHRRPVDPYGWGPARRDGMNAHLSDADLDRRIAERDGIGKPTFLLRLERSRRRGVPLV
jgi:hypothetical protein